MDEQESLSYLRNKYPGYLIINVLANNRFEMFDKDIYTMANFLGIPVRKSKQTHIFNDYKKVIEKLLKNKKYDIIVIKDNKVEILFEDKKEKELLKKKEEEQERINFYKKLAKKDIQETLLKQNKNENKEKTKKVVKDFKPKQNKSDNQIKNNEKKKKLNTKVKSIVTETLNNFTEVKVISNNDNNNGGKQILVKKKKYKIKGVGLYPERKKIIKPTYRFFQGGQP